MKEAVSRRLPAGAEPGPEGTHFRVWAPDHDSISVVIESDGGETGVHHALTGEQDGYFSGIVPDAGPGTRYRLRLPSGRTVPDPASRYQPEGPHGPSVVIDPGGFHWTDSSWNGPGPERHVIYEMHVGTFTKQGTWAAASDQLPALADLGITIIELMPVAEFPGRFNWGYDGVAPFAPAHVYGMPADMRRYVDRAHSLGLAVILDVVYNHMGPDGCYLQDFARSYFSDVHTTDWGPALNFDGPGSTHVREFFIANAVHWIDEYHLDGFRFDATQNVYDDGPHHILAELTERARTAAGGRRTWMVAENEPQRVQCIRQTSSGGFGMDAMWNDDFHHTAMVTLTGVTDGYFSDYRGSAQELISCARHGFLFQGQYYTWQRSRRGTSTRGVAARRFVNYFQNHDQIANSVTGERIHSLTGPGELRTMTALLLLMPGTAMLFQGQEFASSAPFLFFADHEPELAVQVHAGRREFLSQFRSAALAGAQERIDDPAAAGTFERCRIDHAERVQGENVLRLHRDLIALSRTDAVFARQDAASVDGAVLGERALALRYRDEDACDRLLVVNFGADLRLEVLPEPLLAPPAGSSWRLMLSTDALAYGGRGAVHPELTDGWLISAHSAAVLRAEPETDEEDMDV